jgi:hypothetical protein
MRGGGDGSASIEITYWPYEGSGPMCPTVGCNYEVPAPELYTAEYWQARGITNPEVIGMICSAISTGAVMHWS